MQYDLFELARDPDRSDAVLVLMHGFGRKRGCVHGERLAAAVAAVMTPNIYFRAAFSEVRPDGAPITRSTLL